MADYPVFTPPPGPEHPLAGLLQILAQRRQDAEQEQQQQDMLRQRLIFGISNPESVIAQYAPEYLGKIRLPGQSIQDLNSTMLEGTQVGMARAQGMKAQALAANAMGTAASVPGADLTTPVTQYQSEITSVDPNTGKAKYTPGQVAQMQSGMNTAVVGGSAVAQGKIEQRGAEAAAFAANQISEQKRQMALQDRADRLASASELRTIRRRESIELGLPLNSPDEVLDAARFTKNIGNLTGGALTPKEAALQNAAASKVSDEFNKLRNSKGPGGTRVDMTVGKAGDQHLKDTFDNLEALALAEHAPLVPVFIVADEATGGWFGIGAKKDAKIKIVPMAPDTARIEIANTYQAANGGSPAAQRLMQLYTDVAKTNDAMKFAVNQQLTPAQAEDAKAKHAQITGQTPTVLAPPGAPNQSVAPPAGSLAYRAGAALRSVPPPEQVLQRGSEMLGRVAVGAAQAVGQAGTEFAQGATGVPYGQAPAAATEPTPAPEPIPAPAEFPVPAPARAAVAPSLPGYPTPPAGAQPKEIAPQRPKLMPGVSKEKELGPWVDQILEANRGLNFVDRLINPRNYGVIRNSDGGFSTHLMASATVQGKEIAFPTIVQDYATDRLRRLSTDDAIRYALRTGEYIQFPSQDSAELFASNGYKAGKAFRKAQSFYRSLSKKQPSTADNIAPPIPFATGNR